MYLNKENHNTLRHRVSVVVLLCETFWLVSIICIFHTFYLFKFLTCAIVKKCFLSLPKINASN